MNRILSKFILYTTTKFKPILIRLMPIEFLRSTKRNFVKRCINHGSEVKMEPFDRYKYPDGINLIGFIRGEIGLGQSCRLIAEALNSSSMDFTIYNYEQISSMRYDDKTWDSKITNTALYNINLIHINPPDLALAHATLDKRIWDYKYNIAFWLWELEEFPEDWIKCFSFVDEIWTPSEFASNSIRKKTSLPVKTMIYPISAPTDEIYNRNHFELPDNKFLFLCMYDSNSTIERKNPIAVIKAYKKAFISGDSEVGLVIKINNPQKDDIDKIKRELEGYQNIYILPKIMKKVEVNNLIKNCDVFVSLHRAEGFGLPLAESMLLGTPTIATNWSANTEFSNKDSACLVDYKLVTLEEDYAMYRKGNKWAEPNIEQAAGYMKKLYIDKNYYNQISIKAQNFIKSNLNLKKASNSIENRINEIYNKEGIL